jgi:hypothetical protein
MIVAGFNQSLIVSKMETPYTQLVGAVGALPLFVIAVTTSAYVYAISTNPLGAIVPVAERVMIPFTVSSV